MIRCPKWKTNVEFLWRRTLTASRQYSFPLCVPMWDVEAENRPIRAGLMQVKRTVLERRTTGHFPRPLLTVPAEHDCDLVILGFSSTCKIRNSQVLDRVAPPQEFIFEKWRFKAVAEEILKMVSLVSWLLDDERSQALDRNSALSWHLLSSVVLRMPSTAGHLCA